MLLGITFVYPYVRWYANTTRNPTFSLEFYIRNVWARKIGLTRCVLMCIAMNYTLQVLNILFIAGLDCISVSLSNAVYQLQTVFTIAMSVTFLKDKFVLAEAIGILVSTVGVAMIVIPPLLEGDQPKMPESDDGEITSVQVCKQGL